MKKLKDFTGKDPFSAPEGYFDKFNERLQNRLQEHRYSTSYRSERSSLLISALAATITGICFFFYQPKKSESALSSDSGYADIIESEYFYDLDESYIHEAYFNGDAIHHNKTQEEDLFLQQIDEETIASYL